LGEITLTLDGPLYIHFFQGCPFPVGMEQRQDLPFIFCHGGKARTAGEPVDPAPQIFLQAFVKPSLVCQEFAQAIVEPNRGSQTRRRAVLPLHEFCLEPRLKNPEYSWVQMKVYMVKGWLHPRPGGNPGLMHMTAVSTKRCDVMLLLEKSAGTNVTTGYPRILGPTV